MSTLAPPCPIANWQHHDLGERFIAVAERSALGTTARVIVWPPHELPNALHAVDVELSALDLQASRFHEDSEISQVNASQSHTFFLSEGLAELMATALAAAQLSDGLVDPTVGGALIDMGYDRDFSAVQKHLPDPPAVGTPSPGWTSLELNGRLFRRPTGIVLDLGATAKGVGSDRSAPRPKARSTVEGSSSVWAGIWPSRVRVPRVVGLFWWPRSPWPTSTPQVPSFGFNVVAWPRLRSCVDIGVEAAERCTTSLTRARANRLEPTGAQRR